MEGLATFCNNQVYRRTPHHPLHNNIEEVVVVAVAVVAAAVVVEAVQVVVEDVVVMTVEAEDVAATTLISFVAKV
ncbi:hypothetical protein Hanom_Chr14g01324401 [Helianthus anomalus]